MTRIPVQKRHCPNSMSDLEFILSKKLLQTLASGGVNQSFTKEE
jgi:hypothetical protein